MKRYKAEKIEGNIVVTEDRRGNYRAKSSEEIKRALTQLSFRPRTAEVLIGNKWYPLKRSEYSPKRGRPLRRKFISPPPINQKVSIFIKILEKLHLYHSPLEKLIYQPKRDGELPFI